MNFGVAHIHTDFRKLILAGESLPNEAKLPIIRWSISDFISITHPKI